MKKLIIAILIIFIQISLFGQIDTVSVITHEDYFNNPKEYLSEIDSTKVPTGILIDKSQYLNDLILNVNGNDKVTTVSCEDWANIYSIFKDGCCV